MDEEDLASLEQDLLRLAEALGDPGAVDDYLFRWRDAESGVERAMPPRERVMEKIRVLDRMAALMDRRTFKTAMNSIRSAALRGQSPGDESFAYPESAFVLNDNGDPVIRFEELPDLTEVRESLHRLLNMLGDETWPP
jgi:hypothetical protein